MCTTTCRTGLLGSRQERNKHRSKKSSPKISGMSFATSLSAVFLLLTVLMSLARAETCPEDCFCISENKNERIEECGVATFRYQVKIDSKSLETYLSVKIECRSGQNTSDISINVSTFKTVEFIYKYCHFPVTPWSKIAKEAKIRSLIFSNAANSTENLTNYFFQGIQDSLQYLDLKINQIKTLPEDIFENLTSLNFLSLMDNNLVTLPETIFVHQKKLTRLDISANKLEYLPEKIFAGLTRLQDLFLYKNSLSTLHPKLFQGLTSLSILELSTNRLKDLPPIMFHGLDSLKAISLARNQLKDLPEDVFHPLAKLERLDLSSNVFSESFSKELFRVQSLKEVYLQYSNISKIPEDLVSYCGNLSIINLKDNKIRELPQKLLRSNTKLEEIDLSNNLLESLHKTIFSNNYLLKKLKLSHNNISVLPTDIFDVTHKLEIFEMDFNSLTVINDFGNLMNLKKIKFNNNKLKSFGLGFTRNIEEIDLSHNNLENVPELQWLQYLHIKEFNLQYNRISRVVIPVIYNDANLRLEHNNITTVKVGNLLDQEFVDIKQEEEEQVKVYLDSRQFICDCEMAKFVQYITSQRRNKRAIINGADELTCNKPTNLFGKKLSEIPPRKFVCPCKEDFPDQCQCGRLFNRDILLNCSGSNMNHLPLKIPQDTTVLYFENNEVTSLDVPNTSDWQNVKEMYFDNNQLVSVGDWKKVSSNLKELSLRGNQLSQLPPDFFSYLNIAVNLSIALGDNPWECDCSARQLKMWLNKNSLRIRDLKEIYCSEMINGSKVLVATVNDEELCPIDDWPYKVQLMSITTVCVILALLLFVVSILYYRNKQTVIAYVYIHFRTFFVCLFNEQDMDEDKIFDAFVSYSSTDRDVALALINELEKKDPSYRLCIHERDWMPGNLITWNIVNSVQNSKRTILVISKDFLESMWFQVEFHTAYYQMLEDRINRLIVIVKGDLPPKETLDKDLQYLISTKTYLIWGERWMWEKLRYAMPHRKQVLSSAPVSLALGYKPNSEMLKTAENKIDILSSEKNEKKASSQNAIQNGEVPRVTNGEENTTNNNKAICPAFENAQVVMVAQV